MGDEVGVGREPRVDAVVTPIIIAVHHWHGFPFGLILVAGIIAFVVSRRRRMYGWRPHGGSAQQILDERYARGEVDAEDYRARSATLAERREAGRSRRNR